LRLRWFKLAAEDDSRDDGANADPTKLRFSAEHEGFKLRVDNVDAKRMLLRVRDTTRSLRCSRHRSSARFPSHRRVLRAKGARFSQALRSRS